MLLIDRMLDKCRFPKWTFIIPGIINGTSVIFLTYPANGNVGLSYFMTLAALVLLTMIYFKNNIIGILTCVLSIMLHIMCMRSIVVSAASLIFDMPMSEVLLDKELYWWTLIVMIFASFISVLLTLRFIPEKFLKIINQHNDQNLFLVGLAGVFNIYMIFNGKVFETGISADNLESKISQIILPVVFLVALYLGVFMLIRFDKVVGYKVKNEELEKEISSNLAFRNAVVNSSTAVCQVNCTKGNVVSVISQGEEINIPEDLSFDSYFSQFADQKLQDEDANNAADLITTEKLIFAYENGQSDFVFEHLAKIDTGELHWHKTTVNIYRDEATFDIMAVFSTININELKVKEEILKYNSQRDSLVGAYNKKTTEDLISMHIESHEVGTLLLIDLDNFKNVNDTRGHLYGDEVLKRTYDAMHKTFRSDDIIGRIGGDEFMVFVINSVDKRLVSSKAKTLCSLISSFADEKGENLGVSASIGIAIVPIHGKTFEEIYQSADMAMYSSKHRGKNTYTIFSNANISDNTRIG